MFVTRAAGSAVGLQHAHHDADERLPLGGLRAELPAAHRSEAIHLGIAAKLRRAPLARDPPALLTQRGDSARTGANAFERALSVSTVTPSTFGKLFTRAIDGDVYAQPLYVAGVVFADRTRNVLVVATENDSVYAFDADDPSSDAPLWKVTIGQATPVPNPWFAIPTDFDACRTATFNQRSSGITSTPVIDPTTSTIYVVGLVQDPVATTTYPDCVDVDPESDYRCLTSACDGPVFRVELHALDLVTGAERSGSPAVVGGSVPGNGDASENGVVT